MLWGKRKRSRASFNEIKGCTLVSNSEFSLSDLLFKIFPVSLLMQIDILIFSKNKI